ncbi:MAG: hypothetical protein N2255_08490, partial [Kiritimatiellae bacterium]|nr:hypothetical protein [Kiritimatiellia bacterium]
AVQRRAPHVTARQFVVANLEAGVVKYEASFFYDVLYSGVKFLRLDVPASLASEIRIITPGIRYSVFQEATNDVASGYLPWRIEGEKEFFGTIQLQLRWESKLEKLDVGKSVLIGVPRLMPAKVDRAWGQIVLIKAEAIDVVPGEDLVGLTPIDPRQELMPGVTVRDAARAFEFHDSTWQLPLRITRYEPKDVKTTSIERGLVRMVLTRSGTTSVQALYRIRSVRQRLAIRLPGEVTFESQPLRINGRPVALEQGQSGEYFIPLAGQQSDEAFLVDLRYVVAGSGSTLHVPEFLNEPAVQQVYLSVFLPAERVFLGTKGAWNHELTWLVRGFNASPHGNRNSDDLIAWISADVGVDEGALGGFPTDGQHLLFSTLRPAGGREGALRILWMPRWLFQTMSLAGIILVGLILLPAGSRPRAVAVGTILVLLALLGIFAPSFVRAAVNNATVAAVFIVFVVWVLWFFLVTLPRSSFWQERKLAREERRRARAQAQTQKSPPPVPQPGTPNQASAEGGAGHA